jgi:YHS domain-containing protein
MIGGCAASGPTSAGRTTQPHAECLVCKYNADLACVDVAVDSRTPHCSCDGTTYYFCSTDGMRAFENNPAMYLSQGK